jgi:methionyl-tRNA synthetase
VPQPGAYTDADLAIQKVAANAINEANQALDKVAIHDAISRVWTLVDELNGYITEQEPWALAKDEANRERLATVLYTTAEGLRILAVLLSPIVPKATAKLWAAIGSELGELSGQRIQDDSWGKLPVGTKLGDLEVLFPRVEEQ